jgi:hypothetical protein
MRKRSWRALIGLLGAVVVATAAPSVASASNHLIKIREVYAGSAAAPNSEYVELEMYAPGENFFNAGTSLTLYNAVGGTTETFIPSGTNPPNAQNQQRVLFANTGAQTEFSKTAGYTLTSPNAITDAGGAACYQSSTASFKDCVAWGNFTGTTLPSPTGGNVPAIADGSAISRSIAPGCSTFLEASDDTNKPADWSDVTPNPLNNADTPPEQACPSTAITKAPKSKTTDKTPTFKFKAGGSGVTFECKVDKGHFASCTSPFTTAKLAKGKHTFQVRAANSGGGVGNAAKKTFTVVKKKPHHH